MYRPSSYCRCHQYHHLLLLTLVLLGTSTVSAAFENPLRHLSLNLNDPNNNKTDKNKMRAWTCHGRNQIELVHHLSQAGIVKSKAVQTVMQVVDRANYIPNDAYLDAPQPIGLGQTISAPHMHAHVLEEILPYLQPTPDHQPYKLMDVGVGSGYLAACLGRWLQPAKGGDCSTNVLGGPGRLDGKVFGIDVHAGLVALSTKNMKKQDGDLLEDGVVSLQVRDGWKGIPEEAPFDAIHVGAAADGLPYDLVNQLKVGGVMIIPIGSQREVQTLFKIVRTDKTDHDGKFVAEDFEMTTLLGVRYVPLVHP